MAKSSAQPHRRAYINPLPGYPEEAQRADIEKLGTINAWYVEGKNESREEWVARLRPGDHAVVARLGCLSPKGFKLLHRREGDANEVRGDIHSKGAVLIAAEKPKLRSDKDWREMKKLIAEFSVWLRNAVNASGRRHVYSDREIEVMGRIRLDKRYKNDKDRLAAVGRAKVDGRKIKVPGRTWFVTDLPRLISERGIEI